MWDWHVAMMGNWAWIGGWMIFIWVAVFGLIVWGVIKLTKHSINWTSKEHDTLDILKERYAKGEISREEYETIKKELQ